jgi:chromosome segregation ATPase
MTLPLATNLSCFGLSARPLKRKTFTLSDSDHEQNQPVKRPRVELNLFSDVRTATHICHKRFTNRIQNGRASSEDSSPHCDVDIENQLDDFSNSLADIKSKVSQAEAAHESTKKMVTEFQEKVASDRADVEKELKNAKQENKRVNIKLASALKQVRGVKKDRDELLMKWDSLSESVREAQELAREADQREVALRKDLLTSTEEVAIAQRQADIERRMARGAHL